MRIRKAPENRVKVSRSGFTDDGTPITTPPVAHEGVVWYPAASAIGSHEASSGSFVETTTDFLFLFPTGSDVRQSDSLLTHDGRSWHVVGEPHQWRSPYTGVAPGLMVTAQRVS